MDSNPQKNNVYVTSPNQDEVLDFILSIYADKVGEAYTSERLAEIEAEGADRYEKKIPPGYKDKDKGIANQYGDFIIWKQMIDYAKDKHTDIVFVTLDNKEDWWQDASGRTVGPRYELISEFLLETGQNFLLYSVDSFVSVSESTTDPEVISEIQSFKDYRNILEKTDYFTSDSSKENTTKIWLLASALMEFCQTKADELKSEYDGQVERMPVLIRQRYDKHRGNYRRLGKLRHALDRASDTKDDTFDYERAKLILLRVINDKDTREFISRQNLYKSNDFFYFFFSGEEDEDVI